VLCEELFPSPARLHRIDRPLTLANQVDSLVSRLPFGVSSSVSLLLLSEPPSCLGFVPLRGITDGVHSLRAFPSSRYVPSSGFLNLSTVFATLGFAGLLHPAATSRVVTVQGVLPLHSRLARRQLVPPCRWSSERSPASRLPPSNPSTSRPCSVDRCVPQGRGLAFPAVAPLFGFVLPQVLATRRGPGFPGASARDVFDAIFSLA